MRKRYRNLLCLCNLQWFDWMHGNMHKNRLLGRIGWNGTRLRIIGVEVLQ